MSTQTSEINIETFSYEVMDSIRIQFGLELETGVDMFETSQEEYLLLVKIKNELIDWIDQHCIGNNESQEFNDKITELEEREIDARKSLEFEFGQTEKQEDWGTDKHMRIYRAGSTALYYYLGSLLHKRDKWCN
ncbi:MAG: hypothetical protein WDZ35_01915 [Crocinitomicaceae bacterium]